MKVKKSITLAGNLLPAREYLAALAKSRGEERDAEILDTRAESLNREARDVLEYQDLA